MARFTAAIWKNGGWSFADPPSFNARAARVVWAPELAKDVLDLHAVGEAGFPGVPTMAVADLVPRPALFFLDGHHHIILAKDGWCVQLRISGPLCLDRARFVMAVFMEKTRMRDQLRVVSCLNHLRECGEFRPAFFPGDSRGKRFALVLRALDGKLAGWTNREIAVSLFGERRVETEWNDPGEYLQDQVRRAIRRGQDMMEGGYRSLLK